MTAITLDLSKVPPEAHGPLFALREALLDARDPERFRHWVDALRSLAMVRRIRMTADWMMSFDKDGKPEETQFMLLTNGHPRFYTLKEAAPAYDNGHDRVEFGHWALEPDFTLRPMTDDEKRAISEAADEYSANK